MAALEPSLSHEAFAKISDCRQMKKILVVHAESRNPSAWRSKLLKRIGSGRARKAKQETIAIHDQKLFGWLKSSKLGLGTVVGNGLVRAFPRVNEISMKHCNLPLCTSVCFSRLHTPIYTPKLNN